MKRVPAVVQLLKRPGAAPGATCAAYHGDHGPATTAARLAVWLRLRATLGGTTATSRHVRSPGGWTVADSGGRNLTSEAVGAGVGAGVGVETGTLVVAGGLGHCAWQVPASAQSAQSVRSA